MDSVAVRVESDMVQPFVVLAEHFAFIYERQLRFF